jgi:hypothetical protein
MGFTNSRSRLLLIVAALFLLALLFAYKKISFKRSDINQDKKTKSGISYSRSQKKLTAADTSNKKQHLSTHKNKHISQSNVKTQDSHLRDLRKLARASPLDTVNQVLAMTPDTNQKKAMALVFDEWAQYDPETAAQWIMQNLSIAQQLRVTAARSLATSWVKKSPEKAMLWTDTYFSYTDDHSPFQSAFNTWAKREPEAVGRHLASRPYEGDLSYLATVDFVNIYAQMNLNKARDWTESYVSKDLQSDAQAVIMHELAKTDPSEAANYLLQENHLVNLESNLDALLIQWTNTDADAARLWVEQSLNPNQQQMAYGQLAELFRDQQPELAIEYAQALSNDKFRVETTTDILSDWRTQNTPAADQWISENIDNLNPTILEDIDYVNLAP